MRRNDKLFKCSGITLLLCNYLVFEELIMIKKAVPTAVTVKEPS
jgi:hypothetical protein